MRQTSGTNTEIGLKGKKKYIYIPIYFFDYFLDYKTIALKKQESHFLLKIPTL